MKGLRRVVTLIVCVWTSACYMPPIGDFFDEIYRVERIEEGVTTKDDVLDMFGEPHSGSADDHVYQYYGTASEGYAVFSTVPTATATTLGDYSWWVRVSFDEQDVVANVVTSDTHVNQLRLEKARKKLLPKARQGNSQAQFRLSFLADSGKERWRWLCLSANRQHAVAQSKVGEAYWPERRSFQTVKPDLVQAYVWLSLAASNGYEPAMAWRNDLAEQMNQAQIVEADSRLAEWKPDPASCTAGHEASASS